MIYYLVTSKHHYTMTDYLHTWGRALANVVRVLPYAVLPEAEDLVGSGTFLFSDLERLGSVQRSLLADVYGRLEAVDAVRLVNHPTKSLRRYDLVQKLSAEGKSDFNVYRPNAPGRPWRYPVFIRHENEHTGNLTPLLPSEVALHNVLMKMVLDGHNLSELLIVEYCPTADANGVFRKYSAFRVGDRILPRHVLFSKNWMVKDMDLMDPPYVEEVREYVRTNPHEAEVRALFELAAIEYGRIDYSMRADGTVQTWEINTNPLVTRRPDRYPPQNRAFHERFANAFGEALMQLDKPALSTAPRIGMGWKSKPVWEM